MLAIGRRTIAKATQSEAMNQRSITGPRESRTPSVAKSSSEPVKFRNCALPAALLLLDDLPADVRSFPLATQRPGVQRRVGFRPARCNALLAGFTDCFLCEPAMERRLSPNWATSSSVPPRAST